MTAALPARRSRALRLPPAGLLTFGIVVAAAVLMPLGFLLVQVHDLGWSTIRPLLARHITLELLWNTVRLTLAVAFGCGVLGVAAAWVVERTDVPWRRFFATVLVLPLAMPDFVLAYSWISIDPSVHGYWGAVLVMTLGSYPLVYLPVAAGLRTADPGLEDVARGLGLGRWRTFFRITLHQIRPALVGGMLLVALVTLAEFGTFEILRFNTLTTQIYTEIEIGFSPAAACALSLPLVLLGLVLLVAEAAGRGRAGSARRGAIVRRAPRVPLGRATVPVLLALAGLLAVAIGVPLYALGYLLHNGTASTLPQPVSLVDAAVSTAEYSAAAAALAALAAVPVALLAERYRSKGTIALERSTYIVQAIPAVVVGLSFVYFTNKYLYQLYQSSFELILVYAIMFFPLALVAVRAGVAQTPPGLEELARSLGHRRASVLVRVTLPILAPALAAGFALVFISASTELTATLILHPTGMQTLATGFWAYENDFAYGAAAPYALALLVVATLPGLLLGRWFERVAGADR